ncbi:PQQ-binding-like beta-propeller repeat protein [Actinoplanes sp. NPDC049316]|uniref:outer membrane protein assembly factor BamB family protein n=1 Tax=Actinoplanes sp. NPDC049316 TaxID=3154727 RepID=UPI0034495EC5
MSRCGHPAGGRRGIPNLSAAGTRVYTVTGPTVLSADERPPPARLTAYDTTTGREAWHRETPGHFTGLAAAAEAAYVATTDGKPGGFTIAALSARDGSSLWQHKIAAGDLTSRVDPAAYLHDQDLILYAPGMITVLDRRTGTQRWTAETAAGVTLMRPPTIHRDVVYVPANQQLGGGVLRWRLADGTELPTLWPQVSGDLLTVSGDRVYLASGDVVHSQPL